MSHCGQGCGPGSGLPTKLPCQGLLRLRKKVRRAIFRLQGAQRSGRIGSSSAGWRPVGALGFPQLRALALEVTHFIGGPCEEEKASDFDISSGLWLSGD